MTEGLFYRQLWLQLKHNLQVSYITETVTIESFLFFVNKNFYLCIRNVHFRWLHRISMIAGTLSVTICAVDTNNRTSRIYVEFCNYRTLNCTYSSIFLRVNLVISQRELHNSKPNRYVFVARTLRTTLYSHRGKKSWKVYIRFGTATNELFS